jgi:hypothetical protein
VCRVRGPLVAFLRRLCLGKRHPVVPELPSLITESNSCSLPDTQPRYTIYPLVIVYITFTFPTNKNHDRAHDRAGSKIQREKQCQAQKNKNCGNHNNWLGLEKWMQIIVQRSWKSYFAVIYFCCVGTPTVATIFPAHIPQ